jgi:hypothetical protein
VPSNRSFALTCAARWCHHVRWIISLLLYHHLRRVRVVPLLARADPSRICTKARCSIPLSIFKLKKADEQWLIDSVAARIPRWKGKMLNVAGRTALATATLSAIPIHTSIALCLSPWAINQIDKLWRAFIWCGEQMGTAGSCKVTWLTVCRPHDLGGLGVLDLRRAGVALRARWEWKCRVDHSINWSSLPRNKDKLVTAVLKASTASTVGSGESTFF